MFKFGLKDLIQSVYQVILMLVIMTVLTLIFTKILGHQFLWGNVFLYTFALSCVQFGMSFYYTKERTEELEKKIKQQIKKD